MQDAGLAPEEAFRTERTEEIENEGETPYATIVPPEPVRRTSIVPAGFCPVSLPPGPSPGPGPASPDLPTASTDLSPSPKHKASLLYEDAVAADADHRLGFDRTDSLALGDDLDAAELELEKA